MHFTPIPYRFLDLDSTKVGKKKNNNKNKKHNKNNRSFHQLVKSPNKKHNKNNRSFHQLVKSPNKTGTWASLASNESESKDRRMDFCNIN